MRKIIHIITILVMLISMIGIFPNQTKASYTIQEAHIYMENEIQNQFTYKGIGIFVEFAIYEENGIKHPAYCVNRNVPGVTDARQYTVEVTKAYENMDVWRVLMNGYPYKTAAQLGCDTDIEAYAATKLAVYDALYHYDWSDFKGTTDSGETIITVAEAIATQAKQDKENGKTKPEANITLQKLDESWEIDEQNPDYVSKTYHVDMTATSENYEVEILGENSKDIILQDTNGQKKTTFLSNEDFKILIPITRLDKDGEFQIKITADLETYPILYGKEPSNTYQDYALTGQNIEITEKTAQEKFYQNTTKIKIVKKDAQTGETKAGAKFNILNEKKEIVYADVTTDEEGIAIIENIIPGKYYIEETKAPEDYVKYDELIEIEVNLNETYTVNVENQKDEEKDVPPESGEKEITVTGKVLPRTGY